MVNEGGRPTQGLVKYAQEVSHVREEVWNDPSGIDSVTRIVGVIHQRCCRGKQG